MKETKTTTPTSLRCPCILYGISPSCSDKTTPYCSTYSKKHAGLFIICGPCLKNMTSNATYLTTSRKCLRLLHTGQPRPHLPNHHNLGTPHDALAYWSLLVFHLAAFSHNVLHCYVPFTFALALLHSNLCFDKNTVIFRSIIMHMSIASPIQKLHNEGDSYSVSLTHSLFIKTSF